MDKNAVEKRRTYGIIVSYQRLFGRCDMDKPIYENEYYQSYESNYVSTAFLNINSCGISRYVFKDKNIAVRQHRPDGRVDYHLLYMVGGKKEITIKGKKYWMQPGDAVFYMPSEPHDYTFFVDDANPVTESFYIHFSGTSAAEAVEKSGITESCFIHSAGGKAGRLMISVITAQRGGDSLTACGQLLRLLSLLGSGREGTESETARRIHRQAEYINAHFAEEIDLDRCAAEEGLSRSRFSHLFTEIMGMSPYKYQLSLRLDRAKELLSFSSLSVGEISASVGFSDPLYFSRIFRKWFSLSPSDFRKEQG